MKTLFTTCGVLKNNFSKVNLHNHNHLKNYSIRLQEVGHLELQMASGNYKSGQIFLHNLLAYRGVILFPWIARCYDRDVLIKKKRFMNSDESSKEKSTEGESSEIFYNVLMDSRDTPFIRSQSEVVTFLGSEDSEHGLVLIPGMDYVAHKNILPYKPTEKMPLQHELLNKFFAFDPDSDPPLVAKNTLRAWEKKNHSWLELTKVHQETSESVRVTVVTFYMGCRLHHHWWRYNICLENLSELAVRLRERHWRIFTNSGALETVRGRGQEVILSRREPVFQYSSHVSLDEPSGHMWGSFRMEREDGLLFDCVVPSFALESKGGAMIPPDSITE